jgi:hypothetical protein
MVSFLEIEVETVKRKLLTREVIKGTYAGQGTKFV